MRKGQKNESKDNLQAQVNKLINMKFSSASEEIVLNKNGKSKKSESKNKVQNQIKHPIKRKMSSSSDEIIISQKIKAVCQQNKTKPIKLVDQSMKRKMSSSSDEVICPKYKSKLQGQVKQSMKRKSSSSSNEEIPVYCLKKLEEMQQEIEKYKKGLDNHLGKQKDLQQTSSVTKPDDKVDDNEDSQLYGSNYEEKMVSIGNGIFCRKVIYDMALGSSHKSTHVARKLLEGVFKTEVLNNATLTGQSPRAQGPERQNTPVVALDVKARNSIIDFSMQVAKDRSWIKQNSKEIQRSMSQRLGEIKREQEKLKKKKILNNGSNAVAEGKEEEVGEEVEEQDEEQEEI